MFVPIDGFAPDADPTNLGALLECDNLIPTLNGMKALPQDVDAGITAAPSAIASIVTFRLLDGTTRILAGTKGSASAATSRLLQPSVGSWTDQTGSAGPYTATSDARWVFAQYGDTVYAAQRGCQIQKSPSAAFTAVAGAPKALIVETVLDFVMAFNTDDTDFGNVYGNDPDRWWCSAAGNPDSWTADIATQATTGLLTDTPGAILGAKRIGSNIAAFKQTSMYLGRYVGAPTVWSWQLVPGEGLGSWSQYGIVDVEGIGLLFIGYDNIYSFDGTRATPIGTNRVARFLFNTLAIERADNIVGFHHRQEWRVYWFFPSQPTGELDRYLVYNYRAANGGRWGYGEKTVQFAFEYLAPGIPYDDLGDYYATYEDLPAAPYESAFVTEGTFKPAVLGNQIDNSGTTISHVILTLEGVGADCSLRTAYYGQDGIYSLIERVRPRFKTFPTTGTQVHTYVSNLGETDSTSAESLSLVRGSFDHLCSARWHRFKQSYTGSMELLGWDIEAKPDSLE